MGAIREDIGATASSDAGVGQTLRSGRTPGPPHDSARRHVRSFAETRTVRKTISGTLEAGFEPWEERDELELPIGVTAGAPPVTRTLGPEHHAWALWALVPVATGLVLAVQVDHSFANQRGPVALRSLPFATRTRFAGFPVVAGACPPRFATEIPNAIGASVACATGDDPLAR